MILVELTRISYISLLFSTGPENVSGPSFPGQHKKKRRALRANHPLNKPAESHNHHAKPPVPEKPTGNVFDRLSTHSTISASKKTHPHPSVEKGRPAPKPHAPLQNRPPQTAATQQQDEQYQLDQDTPTEPVTDRIARIEKELALNSNTPFKRGNSNDKPSSQPSKIQKIINAQFSSLSSSLFSRQDIPRSRPTTTATTTSSKPTANHPAQTKYTPNSKAAKPAAQAHPPAAKNRRSLYNELHMQKTAQLQQNEKIRSSTPTPSSASRPSTTSQRSLYHELQYQKNSPSHQTEKEKPLTTPNPPSRPVPLPSAPQSQAPRPPSLIPQSLQLPISPQLPQPSQLPPSQAQSQLPSQPLRLSSQPPRQDDAPMKEAEEIQNDDDDTATSDFFEDLLRARKERAHAPEAPLHTEAKTSNFFDSLVKSSQERYSHSQTRSPNGLEEKESTGESPATFFGNLLKTSEKRHTIQPLQQQQRSKENAHISHDSLEKHKQPHSLHTVSQTLDRENRGEPSRASFVDMNQPNPQASYKRPSVPSHIVIATGQRKENVPQSVPAKDVLPRSTLVYATPSKQKYTLQEGRYFTDQRIAKARKALRESKERTRKWLEALSPNQPMKQ